MGAGYAVLTIEQGSLFSTTLELKDGNDNAIDLTGYTGQSYFRKSYYSDNNVYQLTVGVNSPETDGKITLSATSE